MGNGEKFWLGLLIGNTRWHWGAFEGDRWLGTWHTAPLSMAQVQQLQRDHFAIAAWRQLGIDSASAVDLSGGGFQSQGHCELWMASVVKHPVAWLADYPALHCVDTAQVPLRNSYSTLGVDRALALVGAGETWGWPVLVIDCGTAMTFTAGADGELIGGAILPGLRSQFRALHTDTDQLPALDTTPSRWPRRWATDTAGAIASGILHTHLAGMRDFIVAWEADYPGGAVVLTGGDSDFVIHHIKKQTPALTQRINHDPDLGFWGLRVCRRRSLESL
ncbi:MAG: pantothenate kinase [Nodosilinea sp.]